MKKETLLTFIMLACGLINAQNSIDTLMISNGIRILDKKLRIAETNKNYEKCISLLDSLIILKPKDSVYYYKKGFSYKKQGKYEFYEKNMNLALKHGFDTLYIYDDFFRTFKRAKDYDKSLFYAEYLIRIQPENGDLYFNIAGIYSRLNNKKKYNEYLKKSYDMGSIRAKRLIDYQKSKGTWLGFEE